MIDYNDPIELLRLVFVFFYNFVYRFTVQHDCCIYRIIFNCKWLLDHSKSFSVFF